MPTTGDEREPPAEHADADGRDLMAEGAARLLDGVHRLGAAWVVRAVTDLVDAWGKLDAPARAQAVESATVAGAHAARRVEEELRTLFSLDPAAQRATPLEIIRSLRREASAVLFAAGVPEVVRIPSRRGPSPTMCTESC